MIGTSATLQLPLPLAGNASPTTPSGGLIALRSSFLSSSTPLRSNSTTSPSRPPPATLHKISARLASKQAYICRDCGYIYNERTPFEKAPDSFYCPVCGAPKRRFKVYEKPVAKNANSVDVRKSRKADLKRNEAFGQYLPIAVAIGVIALIGLYFFLNNAYQT